MAMVVREQLNGTTTILDLPYEMITQICSNNVLTTTDIYNLAKSHPKLNDCLFNEENSSFWKAKYDQKFDDSNINEFEIANKFHNTWRNEIMFRMNLNKSVIKEIMQMPSKYMRFKNIPCHVYPFGEELNSNNQNRQYYIYYSILDFYKNASIQCEKKNQNVEYMAELFLMYASKVFYGYKIKDFLRLPLAEQTNERGFYLLGRWWCPTDIISYNDLRGNLDATTLVLYNLLYSKQPLHSMFKNGYDFNSVIKNGKSNLDHDLYNKAESLKILECINDYILQIDEIVCPCHHKFNCFLLQKALDYCFGSKFILSLLYESIARRLGVKVGIILTYLDTYLSWTSTWPGEINKYKTTFSINIPNKYREERTVIEEDYRNVPKNSVSDLLLTFSKFNEELPCISIYAFRNALYFQKLLKPEDIQVQSRFEALHEGYEFCPCPLFRTPLNPLAPKHTDEKCNLYANWEDIFPLVPNRRRRNSNPKYSIGMLIKTNTRSLESRDHLAKCGIIVGWSKISYTPWHDDIIYYMLVKPHPRKDSAGYTTPDIETVFESSYGKLRRLILWPDFIFKNIYKYFKYYDPKLCAFVPIDDLAKCYPDDFAHTINS